MHERVQEVRNKVAELVTKANQVYNITLPDVAIRFDLKGRCAGQAGFKHGQYYMRFNLEMMRGAGWDHIINDTVPHELAHIVCFFKPALGRQHDNGWRRVCMMLGGSGERCHSEEVVYAKGHTFAYTTSTGHTVSVSETIHRRIQQGRVYRWRGKGHVHAQCEHQLIGAYGRAVADVPAATATTTHTPTKTAAIPQTTFQTANGTNADKIRARIRAAKQAGEGRDVVIQWGVSNLGQSRSLATAYVKNNWDKA
jgi:predicted SprT family Zn-dependent metalloprotease